MTPIQNQIAQTAARLGFTLDPRHVEAMMRHDPDTLNHLHDDALAKYCRWTANAPEHILLALEVMAQTERL